VPDAGPATVTAADLVPRDLDRAASRAARVIDFLDQTLTDLQELIIKHHALPLRTGRETLSRLPGRKAPKLAALAPPKPRDQRLPEGRP
jgi:hypothetical protein